MANTSKRIKRVPGDIVRIDLGSGWHTYGRVFPSTVGIYDCRTQNDLGVDEIVVRPLLFRLWVMDYAIKRGIWPVEGHRELDPLLAAEPVFYKQDPITGRLYLTRTGGGDEIPATLEQCQGLECAAIWDPEHVVDRIADHYAGTPNIWLKDMEIDERRIPH